MITHRQLKLNQETWLTNRWRPMMAWMYMAICVCDFMIFPIAWAIFQAQIGAKPVLPWNPLTLEGAGLFHMAMGAILGITAWSRGQEKILGVTSMDTQIPPADQPVEAPVK